MSRPDSPESSKFTSAHTRKISHLSTIYHFLNTESPHLTCNYTLLNILLSRPRSIRRYVPACVACNRLVVHILIALQPRFEMKRKHTEAFWDEHFKDHEYNNQMKELFKLDRQEEEERFTVHTLPAGALTTIARPASETIPATLALLEVESKVLNEIKIMTRIFDRLANIGGAPALLRAACVAQRWRTFIHSYYAKWLFFDSDPIPVVWPALTSPSQERIALHPFSLGRDATQSSRNVRSVPYVVIRFLPRFLASPHYERMLECVSVQRMHVASPCPRYLRAVRHCCGAEVMRLSHPSRPITMKIVLDVVAQAGFDCTDCESTRVLELQMGFSDW